MKYEYALKRAKSFYDDPDCIHTIKWALEKVFPELKKIKDERMIQYFKDLAPFDKADELYSKYGFSHKDAIAWLEILKERALSSNEWKPSDAQMDALKTLHVTGYVDNAEQAQSLASLYYDLNELKKL